MIIHMPIEQHPYDIQIGFDTLSLLKDLLIKHQQTKAFILTDETVHELYKDTVGTLLDEFDIHYVVVKAGETSKSIETFELVSNTLIQQGIKRDNILIALGGGVIGDLGGFVASTLYRGIAYIQIPTTLLAMVDSSIGGKTGINTALGKNLIGAFHHPLAVIIDLDFLNTLPNHEYKNGMAEIIKAGFIGDQALLEKLEAQDIQTEDMITRAILVKKTVVIKDPYDHHERMFLNFGHTFGHAFENKTNYTVSHGFAVAEGMIIAIRIGIKLGLTERTLLKRIHNLLERYDLGLLKPNPNHLIEQTDQDKKNLKGTLNMVLLEGVGQPKIVAITKEDLYGCFNRKTT